MLATLFMPFMTGRLPIPTETVAREQHEVWLQRSEVAGFQYYEGEKVRDSLKVGDSLTLIREPDNPHDSYAVEVFWQSHKLGYVPRYENYQINDFLKHDATLRARIKYMTDSGNPRERVTFDIYLTV